ncbi:anti-sigma factor antagonist [Streptosporangium violaceochromogenes]|nr:anti-sigma factor antagonist [Streptosporangium violaceochromogenes]
MTTAVHVSVVPDDTLERICLVALNGELDHTNAERFRRDLQEAVGSQPSDIVIDLTGLTFCDSTGVQVFLAIRRLVHDRGCALSLANPQPRLSRLFHLTGLGPAFGLRPTVAEAVEAVRSGRPRA